VNRQIDNPKVQLGRTKEQIKIPKRIELAKIGGVSSQGFVTPTKEPPASQKTRRTQGRPKLLLCVPYRYRMKGHFT
jgi:hypothetical protein